MYDIGNEEAARDEIGLSRQKTDLAAAAKELMMKSGGPNKLVIDGKATTEGEYYWYALNLTEMNLGSLFDEPDEFAVFALQMYPYFRHDLTEKFNKEFVSNL